MPSTPAGPDSNLRHGRAVAMFAAIALAAAAVRCSDDPPAPPDTIDAGAAADASADGGADGGAQACASTGDGVDAGPEPSAVIAPIAGELTIVQLRLPGTQAGESAAIVGPDGTIALVDLGNTSHDDDVRDFVRELNTKHLTPARGFPARAPLQVEWLVLTHFHGDHVGAFEDLLVDTDEPLDVRKGIVHRGFVDVGDALNTADFKDVCTALKGQLKRLDVPLCRAEVTAPCDDDDFAGAHEADACPGLLLGSLEDPSDDSQGAPTRLSLGGCATLTLLAADAFVSDGTRTRRAPRFGHGDDNEENARSLVGLVAHGPFRYHFGGDLTGAGTAGVPDVETFLARTAGGAFWGALGVDVAHAHHHARRTSSNAAIVAALAPADGRSRNVIGGINPDYLGSPQEEVLRAWADGGRLGDGWFWVTDTAIGAEHPRLKNADGPVLVQTLAGGAGYRVQAAGEERFSQSYRSVR